MLLCANAALEENKQRINELNVFPVPDGDTGTNMSLTMNSAAIELGRKQTDTVGAVADCAASALLRGARGNSGVILSLLFRGIAKSLKGRETASAAEFAAAVSAGVDAAYKAVMKPAEGTILTVSRLGAQAAVEFAKESTDFEAMLEALLAAASQLGQAPDEIFSMLNDADMTYPDAVDSEGNSHPVTHGTFISLMMSPDRTLRESAFRSVYGVYGQFRNTSAAVLSSQMKQLQFFANARRYPSALHAALADTEAPVEIYHNLIKAVHDNFPAMHRYVRLRKRLLGVDKLHYYDLYTPIVADEDMKVTFEEGKELARKALAPMGEDYLKILEEGFSNRWIDVYENQGKRSGAYSAGVFGVHPFVLLNYTDTLDDVFTLVHEMGHALHSYLSNHTQTVTYANYVIFVAEVASTCNEALLMQYLLGQTKEPRRRAYLINHFLEQFRTTLYRQTMFAEFELWCSEQVRKGEALTAESLCAKYGELNRQYYGEDIEPDPEIALEWARIPHFYYNFYVYQYATGFSCAIALSQRILREGKPAVDDYIRFLSGGCSADPVTLLRGAGVDIASPAPVSDALKLFDQLIGEMEELTAE